MWLVSYKQSVGGCKCLQTLPSFTIDKSQTIRFCVARATFRPKATYSVLVSLSDTGINLPHENADKQDTLSDCIG